MLDTIKSSTLLRSGNIHTANTAKFCLNFLIFFCFHKWCMYKRKSIESEMEDSDRRFLFYFKKIN
jgi:hypothetical protein